MTGGKAEFAITVETLTFKETQIEIWKNLKETQRENGKAWN